MLIKEYRFPLPLKLSEFDLAQHYTILKKCRTDTTGPRCGLELISNEPYVNGPRETSGRYTFKVFHIEGHQSIPTWLSSLVSDKALQIEENGWSSYPFGRSFLHSRYFDHERCSVMVDTLLLEDDGTTENAHALTPEELAVREIEMVDFVSEPQPIYPNRVEEDPALFSSQRTGRGPLSANWLDDVWRNHQKRTLSGECHSLHNGINDVSNEKIPPFICSYAIARIHFDYWGLQTRVERWIDTGIPDFYTLNYIP